MGRHSTQIPDWNVVVSIHGDNYVHAKRIMAQFGEVSGTGYYNVLVMRVSDIGAFLHRLERLVETAPDFLQIVARVLPAQITFDFEDVDDFERRAREAALAWAPQLLDKTFYVRLHRRGYKGRLLSPVEERFLDEALLRDLDARGHPGRIRFADSDAVIDVETVGSRAGMALWRREDLHRYPFLRIN